MSNDKLKQRQEVIFFFGAGASVDAGIPDTYRFVETFKAYVKNAASRLYEQLVRILEIRKSFNEKRFGVEKKQVDVEQLLYTLERLIEKDKDALLDFYERKRFNSNLKAEDFLQLKELLEEFIREKVIVEDEKRLEYLKELLKFDPPLEIYSTNYDTCIEQLSHINHLRYTDGFDIYWNAENFGKDFDVKHFKMHGSVIWYENKKTKEIVKIPVHGFIEGKKVDLRLIYGEDVQPLLIYPAQKPEYVEPLTELQLMLKKRLVTKETKVLVVVGYSFRDDYIIHMLWDASRINDDLRIIVVSPSAQEQYEHKLKFIDRSKKDLSRIHDRVVCLPYPFSTVIYELKNHYLQQLGYVCNMEKNFAFRLKVGQEPEWENLLRTCIDCEFSTKTEQVLERSGLGWHKMPFHTPQQRLLYGMRAMLHSVIVKDGFEQKWVNRVNGSLRLFSIEKLSVRNLDERGFKLVFEHPPEDFSLGGLVERWINPVLDERDHKLKLLSPRFEKSLIRAKESFNRLERFRDYLDRLRRVIEWAKYLELRAKSRETDSIKEIFNGGTAITSANKESCFHRLQELVLSIERRELERAMGGKTLKFQLQD